MAKILKIKAEKNQLGNLIVTSEAYQPKSMTEEEVNEALQDGLTLAISDWAYGCCPNSVAMARRQIVELCAEAMDAIDDMATAGWFVKHVEEECDECAGCCEAADDCDH